MNFLNIMIFKILYFTIYNYKSKNIENILFYLNNTNFIKKSK